ncbi:RPM1-interacting protein 4-like [Andrographis paniculata]|uniref:RPM1-interacting protein 4-like n=1 Tax=Andrographis paniculata TaxID=175694 RepID=UPI0021E7745E|nr:RPM1-interacting protein 4-like [Andrographis paniculata]
MARAANVPKFGNWENEANVPYTVYFDKARKNRGGGKMMNPNDPQPQENPPEWFAASAHRPSTPTPRPRSGELIKKKIVGNINAAGRRGAIRPATTTPPPPEEKEEEDEDDSKRYLFDNNNNNNDKSAQRQPQRAAGRSEQLSFAANVRVMGMGRSTNTNTNKLGSSSPIWEGKSHHDGGGGDNDDDRRRRHNPNTNIINHQRNWDGRSRLNPPAQQTLDRGKELGKGKGGAVAVVPPFGGWNEQSAENFNFTHVFNKVREERERVMVIDTAPATPTHSSSHYNAVTPPRSRLPIKSYYKKGCFRWW